MKHRPLTLTLPQYERIFRIIHSFYTTTQPPLDRPNCLFYNYAGARILEDVLGIQAVPVCGAAFFKLADERYPVLGLGHIDEESRSFFCSPDGFHSWVATEKHLIDFTAPLYQEYLRPLGAAAPKVAPKMFQKSHELNRDTPWEVTRIGDFCLVGDLGMTEEKYNQNVGHDGVNDLVLACGRYYVRPPKPLPPPPMIVDNLGMVARLALSGPQIVGSW